MWILKLQEPMKTKAPQLHMEYRFYRILGSHGKACSHLAILIFHQLWVNLKMYSILIGTWS
jgi:hypothetical protein